MMVFFWTRLGKILICQTFSGTWESDFKLILRKYKKVLLKSFKLLELLYFTIWVFFHQHSRFTEQQGKGKSISLTSLSHFQPLHRYLDISLAIAAEISPLHIASIRIRTRNLWFPSANHWPLSYAPRRICKIG